MIQQCQQFSMSCLYYDGYDPTRMIQNAVYGNDIFDVSYSNDLPTLNNVMINNSVAMVDTIRKKT